MHPPAIGVMDLVGPVVAALAFVALMSLVREPTRRTVNVMLAFGAAGAYMSGGGFGAWEILYPVVVFPIVYRGFHSYAFVGIAWLLHSCWDIAHHLWGNPIWPFMQTSSFGCMIFDAAIALWFFANAPSAWSRGTLRRI